MRFHFILAASTFLTGVAFVAVGTDFGNIPNVTVGVIFGATLMLLGLARFKFAWREKKMGIVKPLVRPPQGLKKPRKPRQPRQSAK